MNDNELILSSFEDLHVCPVCQKYFVEEKAMYQHVLQAHEDQQYMAYDMQADMYERWQDRHPRVEQ
jgi:hypothetical protein